MKTNISIDIEPSDLRNEMQEVIREIAGKEIKAMINSYAKEQLKIEVDKFIEPMVIQFLTNEHFSFTHSYNYNSKNSIKGRLRDVVANYFDEQVYTYSKSSGKMSERFMTCSLSNKAGSPTRLQAYIYDTLLDYFDHYFKEQIIVQLDEIVDNKNKLEEAVKSQLSQLVNSKLK